MGKITAYMKYNLFLENVHQSLVFLPYKLVSKILDSQTFSRAETIFHGYNFALIYHGWNYFLWAILTTFSRVVKRFDGWKSREEIFSLVKWFLPLMLGPP